VFETTDGRDMSFKAFLEENEINWETCTDRMHSMSGQNAGLLTLVRKKAPHIIWTKHK
jgi:hypothetical protein